MKKIVCMPAPEIEIECGGESILLRFDVLSIAEMQSAPGGIETLMSLSIPEMAAAIVYYSGKNCNKDFTLEKARSMVAHMNVANITEIIEEYSEAMGVAKNAEQSEYSKKLMAQFLNSQR